MNKFPNDQDGITLRSLEADGVDLSIPRQIEFYCYAESQATADAVAKRLESLGYNSSVFFDNNLAQEVNPYTVCAVVTMKPDYRLLAEAQKNINHELLSFGLKCDGWGTLVE